MYRIINVSGGAEIGSTEKPRFIRRKSTGCYVQTTEDEAQGVAFRGTAYNLQGREGLGAGETVMLIEFDGGEAVGDVGAAVEANSAAIDDIIISMLEG